MRNKKLKVSTFNPLTLFVLLLVAFAFSTEKAEAQSMDDLLQEVKSLRNQVANQSHNFQSVEKSIDDNLWFNRVGDIAIVDKVFITGPPKTKQQTKNPTAQGAGNPFKFYAYVFIPKDYSPNKKYPLLVFPHGGVHGNLTTYYTHIIRELTTQGYVVVAPEYRGSTGYGRGTYNAIDYGGVEIEDTQASKDYMLANYDFIDRNRVGILGWSHGGLHTLMTIFKYPKDYKVAYAGMPVSDLVARMGYKTQSYRNLYSANYHIGKTAYADVDEYRRRSPAWNAEKLQTPLLVHTNTNDEDVNVLEVEHLIQALKAEGKENLFQYKIYEDMPGGHSFNRMDYKEARESRLEIYKFLSNYLKPNKPFSSLNDFKVAYYLK